MEDNCFRYISYRDLEEKTYKSVCVGLATLTIGQLFILLALIASWRIHQEPPPLMSSTYCVPCNDINQAYPYTDTENIIDAWRQINNESVCCGPIQNVMELRTQNEMTKQFFANRPSNLSLLGGESFITDCEWKGIETPTARLAGVVDSVPSDIVHGHSKLRWNKNSSPFTAKSFIHLELEGEIFIRRPGYYIVSSTLNVNTTGTINTREFSHSLSQLSHKYGTKGVLMLRKRSIEESDGSVFTSFMSSVFKLYEHDRISVSVSNPNVLACNQSNDHFTAYYTYDIA
ncbi:uncharacterized protein LOC128208999 [Mya arenaria]|uniref:uncharacterized protein LOC128208999 n=1 Tax=Mya arenaria TaxID=6604 RepID=UPI0022E33251|nr:uncharacterized protein LOC128208999 [Mya arenaria]XP_052768747.1 uncharacterized protein LOC128208999 [Mya arenaria]